MKTLTSTDEEGSCKWFNWENIIWLQLFLPQLRCWWRGDDGDVDIMIRCDHRGRVTHWHTANDWPPSRVIDQSEHGLMTPHEIRAH